MVEKKSNTLLPAIELTPTKLNESPPTSAGDPQTHDCLHISYTWKTEELLNSCQSVGWPINGTLQVFRDLGVL